MRQFVSKAREPVCPACRQAGDRHVRGKTINSRDKPWNEVFIELKEIMKELGTQV